MKLPIILLLSALCCLLPVSASQSAKLDDLLRQVQRQASETRQVDRAREKRFLAEKERRMERVEQARAELAALEQRNQALRKTREARAVTIDELASTLAEHSRELQQVFQSARQAATTLDGVLRDSLVSAQLPGRRVALAPLLAQAGTPNIGDLRQLWVLLLQEMVESGHITRFETDLVDADGGNQRATVTRIGVFTALQEGRFLSFDDGRLYVLPHQPGGKLRETAARFERAEQGLAPAVIDPSRGAWLEVLVHHPSLLERVRQGGLIGYLIIALGGIGLLLGLWRLLVVSVTAWRVRDQLSRSDRPSNRNPLGRVLLAWQRLEEQDPRHLELQLQEAALREVPPLTRTQSLLKLLAATSPLLGLLGTVTGMILTFQAITLSGAGNTRLMAEGIGQALVTTVLGLVAAIPLLFLHNLLATRSRAVIQILDQETAGLIAAGMAPNTGSPMATDPLSNDPVVQP